MSDETVACLIALGHLEEVFYELGSGKEATTYAAGTPQGAGVLKLDRDFAARSFR